MSLEDGNNEWCAHDFSGMTPKEHFMDDKEKAKEEAIERLVRIYDSEDGENEEGSFDRLCNGLFDAGLAYTHQWVEVAKDGLPNEPNNIHPYLVVTLRTNLDIAAFDKKLQNWWIGGEERPDVTHYIRIPEVTGETKDEQ